jgi:hypothetical protein
VEGQWQSDILALTTTRISHAYCPSCFTKAMAWIKRFHPAKGTSQHHRSQEKVMHGT